MIFCTSCGKENSADDNYCIWCGVMLNKQVEPVKPPVQPVVKPVVPPVVTPPPVAPVKPVTPVTKVSPVKPGGTASGGFESAGDL